MKNFLLKSNLVFFLITLGCSSEPDSNESDITPTSKLNAREIGKITVSDLQKDPKKIGHIHNEVMDNVYNELLLIKEGKLKPSEKTLEEFVNIHVAKSLETKIDFEGQEAAKFINLGIESPNDDQRLVDFYKELEDLTNKNLITNEFNIEANRILGKYKNYRKDNLYLQSLAAIHSIAINSNEYWAANADKWEDLAGAVALRRPPGSDGRIVRADIYGALRGGLVGAVGGALAGGIGALPGGLLGAVSSACSSSAITGVREHLGYSSWIPW